MRIELSFYSCVPQHCIKKSIFNFVFEELAAQTLSQKQYQLCGLPNTFFSVILLLQWDHEHKQLKLISVGYDMSTVVYLLRLEAILSKTILIVRFL